MKVPLLDLKPQYQSLKPALDEAVMNVVESQYFILGPEVEAFEREVEKFLNVKHALGVSSGTDALLLALMALDIKPSDEIIVPTYSFFATAGVVSRLNAVPVFIDIDPVTYNINPAEIESKITEKTKAIIPVHLYGQAADMDAIMSIAKKHNIKVVEDAAQALSTQYKDGKCVGSIGDAGCFSFFPSKNLGGFGDAGIITTNDTEYYEKMKIMRVHGGEKAYYHRVVGGNFRIDALQAAPLRVKLPHLNSWSQGRRDNVAEYTKLFIEKGLAEETGKTQFDDKNKVLLPKAVYKNEDIKNYHIYNQFIIRVEKRDDMRQFLLDNGVGCAIYYPVPFHRQECFANLGYKDENYPEANRAAEETLALPVFPELSNEQIAYVVEKIDEFVG